MQAQLNTFQPKQDFTKAKTEYGAIKPKTDMESRVSVANRSGQSHMTSQSQYKAYNLKDFKSLQEQ